MMTQIERAWVWHAIAELRKVDSWTGRIHIHKLLFIAKTLGLAKPPFHFQLYQFGPYSFDLDAVIAVMDVYGLVEKDYPKAGYGPRYNVAPEPEKGLKPSEIKALARVANELKNHDSSDLELIATCLWVERLEKLTVDEEIVDRVKQIKPRYDEAQIRQRLKSARSIGRQLA